MGEVIVWLSVCLCTYSCMLAVCTTLSSQQSEQHVWNNLKQRESTFRHVESLLQLECHCFQRKLYFQCDSGSIFSCTFHFSRQKTIEHTGLLKPEGEQRYWKTNMHFILYELFSNIIHLVTTYKSYGKMTINNEFIHLSIQPKTAVTTEVLGWHARKRSRRKLQFLLEI